MHTEHTRVLLASKLQEEEMHFFVNKEQKEDGKLGEVHTS